MKQNLGGQAENSVFRVTPCPVEGVPWNSGSDWSRGSSGVEDPPPIYNPPGALPTPTSSSLERTSFRQLLEQLGEQHEYEMQALRLEYSRRWLAGCHDNWEQANRRDMAFAMELQRNVPVQTKHQERAKSIIAGDGEIGFAQGLDVNHLPMLAEMESGPTVDFENDSSDDDQSRCTWKPSVRIAMRPHWKEQVKLILKKNTYSKKGNLDLTALSHSISLRNSKRSLMLAEVKERTNCTDECWDKLLSRCMVDPAHIGRAWWSVVSVLLLAFDVVLVPVDCFFLIPEHSFLQLMEWTSRVFWSFDILISFITGTFVSGGLEMQPSRVARRYLAVWFPLDLFLVVADWLSLLGLSGGAANMLPLLRALRILRLLRLVRLAKLQSLFSDVMMVLPESVLVCSSLIKMIVAMCLMTHVIACFWYGVGVACPDGWAYELQTARFNYIYMLSVYWTLSQLHGTSPFHPQNAIELLVAAALALMGFIAVALFISYMSHTITKMVDENHEQMQQSCRQYLRTRNVSVTLQLRLNKYLAGYRKRRTFKEQVAHEQELMEALPSVILQDLNEEVRKPVLICYRFLRDIGERMPILLRRICNEGLQSSVYSAKEHVFYAGDESSSLLMAESGSLMYMEVTKNGNDDPFALTDMLSSEKSRSGRRSRQSGIIDISRGKYLCEATLWTNWVHMGDFLCDSDSTLLGLQDSKFEKLVCIDTEIASRAVQYCRAFLSNLNDLTRRGQLSDIVDFDIDPSDLAMPLISSDQHYVFLSHYKHESGTEAALIREEMETHIDNDFDHSANAFLIPIFVDSEDLIDLSVLQRHIRRSHNLALLLTPGVLTRPWCILEIVTAVQNNIPVVPIEIQRPGMSFMYPSEEFYQALDEGGVLGEAGHKVLQDCGVEAHEVARSVRQVFQKIAVPYSPHKATKIRAAEIDEIMKRCVTLKAGARE